MSSATASGPPAHSTRTASSSHSPAPAAIVSATWAATVSSGELHDGDAALGRVRGGAVEPRLGHDGHLDTAAGGHPECRGQSRDPAADDGDAQHHGAFGNAASIRSSAIRASRATSSGTAT